MKLIEELCIFKNASKLAYWLNLFFFYPNLLRALSPVVGAIKEKWLYVPLSGSRVVFGRQKEPNEAFIGFILMKSILVLFLSHPHHNFWDRRPLEESQTHFQKNLNCEFFLSQWLLCFVIIPVNQWSVSSLHFYLRKRRKLTVLDFKHLPSKQLKASIRRFSASVQAKWRHAGGVNEYDIVGIV